MFLFSLCNQSFPPPPPPPAFFPPFPYPLPSFPLSPTLSLPSLPPPPLLAVVLPSVSVMQLYKMLNEAPEQVLVLDCRPRASYTSSHTDVKKCPQWLSIPEEMVLKGYVGRGAPECVCGGGGGGGGRGYI